MCVLQYKKKWYKLVFYTSVWHLETETIYFHSNIRVPVACNSSFNGPHNLVPQQLETFPFTDDYYLVQDDSK